MSHSGELDWNINTASSYSYYYPGSSCDNLYSYYYIFCRLELLKALSDNGKDITYFEEVTGKEMVVIAFDINNKFYHTLKYVQVDSL